jgi:hypothetical protein
MLPHPGSERAWFLSEWNQARLFLIERTFGQETQWMPQETIKEESIILA